jgi:hypothetical protein
VIFDQNVVVDQGMITSDGGPVCYQAVFALLAKLSSEDFRLKFLKPFNLID